ncbi:uncharacterized protein LOC115033516 [Acyrthosiphon pisum]|uniref:Uncharacterized protein n=2 Tax=Acyrthosiphon pisum TaxID=7029 RepID=A0A8R2JM56_ACYPI|nr:uncharacterized protein LOC115033516 [Acyrthosiphon pisum]
MIRSYTKAMQTPVTWFVCLLLLVTRSTSGYTIDEHRAEDYEADQKESKQRDIKPESVLMGIAKTLIGGKMGATSGQNHYCIDRDVYQRSARGFCKLSSLTTLSSPCKFFKMANGFCDLPDILASI